jgi:hypothetical protein
VKYISSKIKSGASAFALDLGASYTLCDRLTAGAVVQNIGTKMKFSDAEESLPLNVKHAGSYLLRPDWRVALDLNLPVDNEYVLGAGTEYVYRISDTMSAAGRLGYSTRTKETGGLNGLSAGFGFTYTSYSIDYAFVPCGDLGNTHRVSLGMRL